MQKNVILLGATGSIGSSTLKVIKQHAGRLNLLGIASHTQWEKTLRIAEAFKVSNIAIFDETAREKTLEHLPKNIELHKSGVAGLIDLVKLDKADIIVSSIVGTIGLKPTLVALEKGKTVALANKEILVMAGKIAMEMAKKHKTTILPIDSEHNALFQCIGKTPYKEISKLILTASGGPFLNLPEESFKDITKKEALKHPNWDMGPKVTIDSSTMANKGLEMIEAYWLFDGSDKKIETVVHPQSIIHAMVQYVDGNTLAHMSPSCMSFAIQNTLLYPDRIQGSGTKSLNFSEILSLSFSPVDYKKFPCLKLAKDCLKQLGSAPTIFNASNEVAVDAFLKESIPYTDIAKIIEYSLGKIDLSEDKTLEEIEMKDQLARQIARNYIDQLK